MSESKLKIEKKEELECGIIMPIAKMDGYSESHWQDIKSIIIEAVSNIDDYNIKIKMVSDSDGEMNIIHKNIISNIYNSDIVICDISGHNPNVLFELGMRLTFDKPTIIIKDEVTSFIFDTSAIETLIYPKDLRFGKVVKFKENLADRLKSTYAKAKIDDNYSTFLGHFGKFTVPKLDQANVTEPEALIFAELSSIRDDIKSLKISKSSNQLSDATITRNTSKKRNISHFPAIDVFERNVMEYLQFSLDNRRPEEVVMSFEFHNFLSERNLIHLLDTINVATAKNIISTFQTHLDIKVI